MNTCPQCHRQTILHGRRKRTFIDLVDGRLGKVLVQVQKYLCRHCGVTYSDRVDGVSARAKEAIIDGVLRDGVTETARRLNSTRSTVQSVFSDWEGQQESKRVAPDVIGVETFNIAGIARMVVFDAVEEEIVEVVDDLSALRKWLEGAQGVPTLAVIGLDPALATVFEEIFPGIEIALSPAAARNAVVSVAETALRAIVRRNTERGRNFREDARMLVIPDDDLSDEMRDELPLWDSNARALRRCCVDILAALRSRDAEAVRRVIDQVVAAVASNTVISSLSSFLGIWRDRILSGIGIRWVDTSFEGLKEIAQKIEGTSMGFRRHIRTFLLFAHSDRVIGHIAHIVAMEMPRRSMNNKELAL